MKKKTSIFQWIILGIFFLLAGFGFVLFSTYKAPVNIEDQVGPVVIWGTMDRDIVNRMIINLKENNEAFKEVVYFEINKDSYNQEILEALAAGSSPDLMLLSNENLYINSNKIYPIPYQSFPKRDFIQTYADTFSIFATNNGILALPFSVDPMVMYYNKSIFATEGIPLPPVYWKEFFNLSKKITRLDDKDNITRATIAFGESTNITNVKGVVSTLMMQLGNKIIAEKPEGGYKTFDWSRDFASPVSGLLFFTEFSNQTNSVYSWNRSLPDSLDYFLSGRLATYFGFASEARNMRLKNPNLNFDVAEIPSVEEINNKTVFARVWGMAIPKSPSVNIDGAFKTALALSNQDSQRFLSQKLNLPPVRKDLLSIRPEDAFMDIFYKEAIYASSFIDPNSSETNKIFKFMIESITGGRKSPSVSVKAAFEEIDLLFR